MADPENEALLTSLIDGPAAQSFGPLESIAVVTAALVILQTAVKFEWKNGKATLHITKPSLNSTALKSLAAKLLAFVQAGG